MKWHLSSLPCQSPTRAAQGEEVWRARETEVFCHDFLDTHAVASVRCTPRTNNCLTPMSAGRDDVTYPDCSGQLGKNALPPTRHQSSETERDSEEALFQHKIGTNTHTTLSHPHGQGLTTSGDDWPDAVALFPLTSVKKFIKEGMKPRLLKPHGRSGSSVSIPQPKGKWLYPRRVSIQT